MIELAVSDGEKVRTSAQGRLSEGSSRSIMDRASADALATRAAFDPDTYKRALANQSALYAGEDDVEGDLCYVVAVPSFFHEEAGSDTSYYWISSRTGMPRSKQTYRILRGKTLITHRWVMSDIRVNPTIPSDAFSYHPTSGDSSVPANTVESSKPTPATSAEKKVAASLVGKQIPDIEIRDTEYRPFSLAQITKGKATILIFWAPWCGACIAEFPRVQALADRHRDDVQIIAMARQDSRLNVLKFIRKHPEYKFVFVTAPNPEDENSATVKFFGEDVLPKSVFIDPKGRIMEYKVGFDQMKAEELEKQVDKWLIQLKTVQ